MRGGARSFCVCGTAPFLGATWRETEPLHHRNHPPPDQPAFFCSFPGAGAAPGDEGFASLDECRCRARRRRGRGHRRTACVASVVRGRETRRLSFPAARWLAGSHWAGEGSLPLLPSRRGLSRASVARTLAPSQALINCCFSVSFSSFAQPRCPPPFLFRSPPLSDLSLRHPLISVFISPFESSGSH